jgi:hypothetical protein
MNLDPDGALRKAFGVIYKKSLFDSFRLLCSDAERLGYTAAMEAYGQTALRLATEIEHDAR